MLQENKAKVAVLLRDQSGFEGEYVYEVEPEYKDSQVFMWEDGNYACDCNRSLFLYGHDETKELPCSPLRMHGGPTITVVSLKINGEERYSEVQVPAP